MGSRISPPILLAVALALGAGPAAQAQERVLIPGSQDLVTLSPQALALDAYDALADADGNLFLSSGRRLLRIDQAARTISAPLEVSGVADGFENGTVVQAIEIDANGLIHYSTTTGVATFDPGTGVAAELFRFAVPLNGSGLAIDNEGVIFYADPVLGQIWRFDPGASEPAVYAGIEGRGFSGDGGPALNAQFTLAQPTGLAIEADGDLYIGDRSRIRRIDRATGIVSTLNGDSSWQSATGLAIRGSTLYVTEQRGLFAVDLDSGAKTQLSSTDATLRIGDRGPLSALDLGITNDIFIEPDGALLLPGRRANRLFRADAGFATFETVAGGQNLARCSLEADNTILETTDGAVAFDRLGRLLMADETRNVVWRLDEGIDRVTAIVGQVGFFGPGEVGAAAADFRMDSPRWLATSPSGDLYFAQDFGSQPGTFVVRDGSGVVEQLSDQLFGHLALDAENGRLFIARNDRNVIVALDLATGVATEVAGTGTRGDSGDGGSATAAELWVRQLQFSPPNRVLFSQQRSREDGEIVLALRRVDLATGTIDTLIENSLASSFVVDAENRLLVLDDGQLRQLSPDTGAPLMTQPGFPFGGFIAVNARNEFYFFGGTDAFTTVAKRSTFLTAGLQQPSTISADDQFGRVTSRSGDRFAVAAPGDQTPNGSGTVAIYYDDGCIATLEDQVKIPEGFTANGYGSALAMDGDTLLVGTAPATSPQRAGKGLAELQAAIVARVGNRWLFQKPVDPPTDASPSFGSSVSLDDNLIAIGDPERNAVSLFSDDGATQIALPVPGMAADFGQSIVLAGQTLVVGAPGGDGAGAVFRYDVARAAQGTITAELAWMIEGDGTQARFGEALALTDTMIAVGAPGSDSTATAGGDVTVLSSAGNLLGRVAPDDLTDGAAFGSALSIDDDLMLVGAPGLSDGAGEGAAFVFDLAAPLGAPLVSKGAGSAIQRLSASAIQNKFGASLNLAAGRSVIGAPATFQNQGDAIAAQINLNLGGLSGLWFDPELTGEGYNVLQTDVGTIVYFYGYEAGGERLWLVSDTLPGTPAFDEPLRFTMFRGAGGTFEQPVSPAGGLPQWGTLIATFSSNTHAVFQLFGQDGLKTSRLDKLASIDRSRSAFSGLWFDPDLAGEGYNVLTAPFGAVVYYYGYASDGEAIWLLSDIITDSLEDGQPRSVPMFEVTGGTFGAPTVPADRIVPWGTLEVSVAGCDTALFELDGEDGRKTSNAVKLIGITGEGCG